MSKTVTFVTTCAWCSGAARTVRYGVEVGDHTPELEPPAARRFVRLQLQPRDRICPLHGGANAYHFTEDDPGTWRCLKCDRHVVVSHGMCPDCKEGALATLHSLPTAEVCPHGKHSHEWCTACEAEV